MVDEQQRGTYSHIYKWLSSTDATASDVLSDELYAGYAKLANVGSVVIDTAASGTVEGQLSALADQIEQRLQIFAEQLRLDGEHEDVIVEVRDASGGWPHLRGLLDDAVLDGYLNRMRQRRTRSEISDAIGAAKDTVEATMKAMASRLEVTPATSQPDLQDWWKSISPYFIDSHADKALGGKEGATQKLLRAQSTTIQALGELRNNVGTGHGRPTHPAGLTSAHALLAVDTAHTLTRFLAALTRPSPTARNRS